MIQTKALYNLVRLNAKEKSSHEIEAWAVEDLRLLTEEALFSRLASLGMRLDRNSFSQYASECDSPEELVELVLDQEQDPALCDRVYLLLFELWRRLLPESPSLSIFCDELDRRIEAYDEGFLTSDESIQNGFANLLEILQEHVDQGMEPKEAFQSISDYCANDLECFLFEWISALLDQGNELYAQELLEEFGPYIADPVQFEFLMARLISFADVAEANRQIAALLKKELESELLFDILHLLVASGEGSLFQEAIKKLLPELKTEEEFQEVLELAADYYRRLDQDEQEEAILKLRAKREQNSSAELDLKDPALSAFETLVCQAKKLKAEIVAGS